MLLLLQVRILSLRVDVTKTDYEVQKEALAKARADAESLTADYNFYLNPANLEKELRARFNYRLPGEKLIIIVPPRTSSTSP